MHLFDALQKLLKIDWSEPVQNAEYLTANSGREQVSIAEAAQDGRVGDTVNEAGRRLNKVLLNRL